MKPAAREPIKEPIMPAPDEQVDATEVSAQTMLGDLMNTVIDELKAAPRVWQEMSEQQQDDVLQRIELRCKDAVRQCVQIIAAEGQIRIPVTIKQTTIKDGVVCQVEFIHSNHVVDMIEAQTKTGMLVLVNSDNFLNEDSKPKAEPDQKAMDLDEEIAA